MKVVAFHGSPRRMGNTEELLRSLVLGMQEAGAEVEVVRLCDLAIQPCIGCGGCEKTGECVLEDAMQDLYPKVLGAATVILASPIYFYGITAQAKAFVDRNQALWSRRRLLEKQGCWPDDSSRKGYLLSVAASHGPKVFDGAILTAQYAFEAMGLAYGGDLLVRGIDGRGEMAKDAARLQQAYDMGRRIVVG